MEIIFEEISEKYITEVTEIYNFYVQNTTVTFHAEPLSVEEMQQMLFHKNPIYKTFVILNTENKLLGYCYFNYYKPRQAYNKTAEITVYLKDEYSAKGIGSKSLIFLEERAKSLELHALLAVICSENTASLKLFERHGYFQCAHFREVGIKFDRMLDVIVLEKII